MFRAPAHLSLVSLLSFGLAFPPTAGAEAALRPGALSVGMVLSANRKLTDAEAALIRLMPDVAPENRAATLKAKTLGLLGKAGTVGESILNLQAIIVMTAAMSVQASREHRERLRLSNGQATQESDPSWTALFGSGEFFMGALGTTGALATNKLSGVVLNAMLKNVGQRSALVGVIGAFASQATLMGVGTASSFLWTEGVKSLTTLADIKRAEGLAGRAFAATTHWSAFAASEDGRVFKAVLENMVNILIVDQDAREEWIYNAWRFGLARGEFLASVGALMGGAEAGSLVIGSFAMGPVTGAVTSTVVGGMLGFGAMTMLLGVGAPEKLTRLIQNARAGVSKDKLKKARAEFKWYSSYLAYDQRPSHQPSQLAYWATLFNTAIGRIQSSREDYVNVMIERFYELLLETKKMEGKVAMAENALRDPKLLTEIQLEFDGQIVSPASVPGDYQRRALDKYKAALAQANLELNKLALKIMNVYQVDVDMSAELLAGDTKLYSVVGPVADALIAHSNRSNLLAANIRYVLAAAHAPLSEALNETYTPEQRLEFTKDLGGYYTTVYSEKKIYVELAKAAQEQLHVQ